MSFWKRFYTYGPAAQQFFDAPDPVTEGGSGDALAHLETKEGERGMSVSDLFKNAPVVTDEDDPDPSKKPGANADDDTDPSKKPDEGAENTDTPHEADDSGKVNQFDLNSDTAFSVAVNGEVYDKTRLQQAIIDHQRKSKWNESLSNRGWLQNIIDSMDGDAGDQFVIDTIARLKAEKGTDAATKAPLKIKQTVKLKDSYDDELEREVEIDLSPESETYKALEAQMEERFKAKYKDVFLELKQHQETRAQRDAEYTQWKKQEGQRDAVNFVKDRQIDLGIDFASPNGVDLEKTLQQIMRSGETNPYFGGAYRLLNAARIAQAEGKTLKTVYDLMYPQSSQNGAKHKAATDKLKNEQNGVQRQKPGGSASPARSDDEKFFGALEQAVKGKDDIFAMEQPVR